MPRSSTPTSLAGYLLAFSVLVWSASPLAGSVQHAHAAAYVTLDSFSGHPGTSLMVTGGGYVPGEQVRVFIDNPAYASVSTTVGADANGEVSATIMIPANAPQGALAISSQPVAGGEKVSNSYYVVPFNPSISISGPNNTPGSVLTVTGSGFASGESVTVALAGATASGTADSDGAVSIDVTVASVSAGTQTVTATGAASGAVATGYFYVGGFYPSSWPSTYYLLPGRTLSFSGAGFAPGEAVNVYEGTSSSPVSTFATGADGTFDEAGGIVIPVAYAGSSRTYRVVGEVSRQESSASITVGQFFPDVYPSAYYLYGGDTLTFSGTSFAPGETVNVYAGLSTAVLASITADEDGSFVDAGAFTVPFSMAGSSTGFRLVGQQSNATVNVGVTVGQFNAQVSPSDYYVTPGKEIAFYGSGFAQNETVDLYIGKAAAPAATFSADKWGNFYYAGATQVPFDASGKNLSYKLVGESSGASSSVEVTVAQLYPQVSPSEYYVKPGQALTIAGSSFVPWEMVEVKLGETVVATVGADEDGAFSGVWTTLPATDESSIALTATGVLSGAVASSTITVGAYYPWSDASNYYATPGSTVTVTGHGFAPWETVTVASGGFSATTNADEFGDTYAVDVTLPFGATLNANGGIDVTLTGSLSKAVSTVSITPAPFSVQVSPSTYYATPGTTVTFTGSGFVAGETVTYDGGSVVADEDGSFAVNAVLPFGSTSADYGFKGATSGATASVSIGLASFYAGLSLDSYYNVGGSAVTLSGSGFYAGESVALTFGGVSLGSATADADGAFSFAAKVPYAAAGSKDVKAVGATSGATAATTFTQAQVYSSIQLGAYAGAAGEAVTFIGSGYLPGEVVEVTNDRDGAKYTFTADEAGSFSDSGYAVPAAYAPGELKLTVTGTYSKNASTITYYVTGA